MAKALRDRQLLWIDLDGRERPVLDDVAAAVGLDASQAARLTHTPRRVDLTQYPDHIHLVLEAMEAAAESAAADATAASRTIDIIAGRNWVLTVHEGPLAAIQRVDAATEG